MAGLTREHAQQVVDRYFRALQQQDLAAIVALYAEDATVEDPVGSKVSRGLTEIEAFYRQAVAQPITAQLTGALRVAGDAVAFPFRAAATFGDATFETEIIDVFHINDAGLITRMQAFWGPDNSRTG